MKKKQKKKPTKKQFKKLLKWWQTQKDSTVTITQHTEKTHNPESCCLNHTYISFSVSFSSLFCHFVSFLLLFILSLSLFLSFSLCVCRLHLLSSPFPFFVDCFLSLSLSLCLSSCTPSYTPVINKNKQKKINSLLFNT